VLRFMYFLLSSQHLESGAIPKGLPGTSRRRQYLAADRRSSNARVGF
jgi:hypothetical protein